MGVNIDDAWCDPFAAGVDGSGALRRLDRVGHLGDDTILHKEAGGLLARGHIPQLHR
mgnify:CR=1 FL=1